MAKAIEYGWISGDGVFTKKCQEYLETELKCPQVFLTTSCSHALEMSALLLDIQPGDEVIVPSFTFVSTVNAFVLRGARPVFIDIRPDTLNMDENQLEKHITPRTKAIVPVHYGGIGCEMDRILAIANQKKIPVIEDNAHGLFGMYRDKCLGTLGCLATLSFHETKNFICGEGGALIINDPKFIPQAEIIREKGTNRSSFFRGEIDRYSWVDLGSSYLPSDLLAAFLFAQLEKKEEILRLRRKIWDRYYEGLHDWAVSHDVMLPHIPSYCEQAYHMFYMILPSLSVRKRMIQHLKSNGIMSVFHYLPLHLSEFGKQLGGEEAHCPITVDISERLLRLPFYNQLSEKEQQLVISSITESF